LGRGDFGGFRLAAMQPAAGRFLNSTGKIAALPGNPNFSMPP
jgi:hypothetical protein